MYRSPLNIGKRSIRRANDKKNLNMETRHCLDVGTVGMKSSYSARISIAVEILRRMIQRYI